MFAATVKHTVIADHAEEIKALVSDIVGTESKPGSLAGVDRLIEIHLSTAVYYARRLAARYNRDVDIVMSDYLMGMFDGCLRLHSGKAKPDCPTAYLLSHGRSVVVNKMENPSTGWNRKSHVTAVKNGKTLPGVQSLDFMSQGAIATFRKEGYSDGFHPSYKDDRVAIMIESEALVHRLNSNQRQALVSFAKGATDAEAARELGWSKTKLETIKYEIITIMEEGRRRRRPT